MADNESLARDEFEPVIQSFIDTHPGSFSDLSVKDFIFIRKSGKSKNIVDIRPLKGPAVGFLTSCKYVMIFYSNNFDQLDPNHQKMHIFRQLLRVEPGDEPKVLQFPITDHPYILKMFGVDWQENTDLPDILDKTALSKLAEQKEKEAQAIAEMSSKEEK